MKTQDISVKLSSYPLIWMESNTGLTSQTSFGNVHISKIHKEAYVYTPFSTTKFYENIRDVDKLMKNTILVK